MSIPESIVDPLVDDRVLAGAAEGVGGPPGRRALRVRDPQGALRTSALAAAATASVAFAVTLPCVNSDGAVDIRYAHFCYSDLPAQFLTTVSESYPPLGPAGNTPPLAAALLWIVSRLSTSAATRFVLACLILSAALVATAVAVSWSAWRRDGRAWDGVLYATAPVIVLSAFVSTTAMAVAFAVAAIALWQSGRAWMAGVGLAFAISTEPVALVIAVPWLVHSLRAGRGRDLAPAAGAGAAAWFVINAPLIVSGAVGSVYIRSGSPRFGSVWFLLEQAKFGLPDTRVQVGSAVATVVVLGAVAWLAVAATTRPPLPALVFLALAGTLLVAPTFRPQDALWVVALLVLTVPRAAVVWAWSAAQLLYIGGLWLYLEAGRGDPARGLPIGWYIAATIVGLLSTLLVVVWVARSLMARDPDDDLDGVYSIA